MELTLHITLQKPPVNVDFGLQKGSGTKFETVGIQRSGLLDMHFHLKIELKGDRDKDQLPDFKGPFVQGPALGRFIYIRIGTLCGQMGGWNRRLKIPLRDITWDMIGQLNNPSCVLQTFVPGTAKDGGPNCATVKPFAGWQVKEVSPIQPSPEGRALNKSPLPGEI